MMHSLHSPVCAQALSRIPGEAFGGLSRNAFAPLWALVRISVSAELCELRFLDGEGDWHGFGDCENDPGETVLPQPFFESVLADGTSRVSVDHAMIPLSGDRTMPGILVLRGTKTASWTRKEGETLFHFARAIGDSLRDKLRLGELSNCTLPRSSDAASGHYRNFYENAIEGFYQTTLLGNYLRANLSLARMYGYESVDELITHSNFTARQLYVERGRREAFVETVSKTDAIIGFESKVCRRDGSALWISESARVIRNQEGEILFFEGTVNDITRQKDAELALLASRNELEERVEARTVELRLQMARFDHLVGNVPGMVYQFGVSEEGKTRLTYVSDGVRDLYGISPGEALANRSSLADLIHPDDSASYKQSIKEAVANLSPWHWLGRVRTATGEFKWIHGKSRPARNADGSGIHSEDGDRVWDGIIIDVTELQEMKTELQRSLQQSSTILDISPDGILTVDGGGVILGVNPAAENMLGSFGRAVTGRKIADLFRDFHGAYGESESGRLFDDIAASPLIGRRNELTGLRADGNLFPVELTLSPIESGEKTIFTVSLRDISSRKRFEKRLRDSRDEAQRANLAKSEFLSRMSHELRTPLNAILGFSQLLVRAEVDPAQSEKLIFIQRAGKHLLDLINEVLDLARIEAGKLCCSIEQVSMRSIVDEIGAYARPLALENRIQLDLGPILPVDLVVLADQQRLKQILLNLVANAIKFNRIDGTVKVRCTALDDDFLDIVIEDTGPGLTPEQLKGLFTPFDRLGADDTKSVGTGIGLALSQSLAELMGTRIEVSSSPGLGSRFSIRLPLAIDGTVSGETVALETTTATQHRRLPDKPGRKKCLLYIEDNPLNLRLIREVVKESAHWELASAETGHEGIAKAIELRPEMIFLDVHLPDLNGDKVLVQLRRDPALDGTFIAMLTADAMGDGASQFRNLGADTFLTKPIDIPAILDLLEEVATRGTGLAS